MVERGKYLQVTTESKAVNATDLLTKKLFSTSKSWTKRFTKLVFKMQTSFAGNYEKLSWLFRLFEIFSQYSLSSNKIHYNILHQKTRIDEIYGEFFMECQYVFRRNFDDRQSVIYFKTRNVNKPGEKQNVY